MPREAPPAGRAGLAKWGDLRFEFQIGTLYPMTATGHALVGTIIAARFENPVLAVVLSLFSHFLCDILPHWDSGTNITKKTKKRLLIEAVFDVLISILLSFIVFSIISNSQNYTLLYLSVFAAQFPDWFSAPYFVLHINFSPFKWMDDFQLKLHNKLDKPWGIVTQVTAIIALYFVLFKVF